MRPIFLIIVIFICAIYNTTAQTTWWTENFNNGCSSNCLASTWNGWTIQNNVGGVSGASPNEWFISCAEEGVTPPGCGSSCVGDACLHIGADPGGGGDMGASFNETGAVNATYKMAVSPVLNGTGYNSNTLQFDFIAYGSAGCSDDRLQLRLSTDGGTTWPVGYQYCLTSACCGACNGYSQGQWTVYSLVLPAAFNNNSTIRVGFHWRNNGNGSGTDPSAGIDDIRITSAVILPLNLLDFIANKENSKVKLKWTTSYEQNFSRFDVEKSNDAVLFKTIGSVPAKATSLISKSVYDFEDKESEQQVVYYRLKMLDRDGKINFSKIVSVATGPENNNGLSLQSYAVDGDVLKLTVLSKSEAVVNVDVYDLKGKLIVTRKGEKITSGINPISIDVSTLPTAAYILNINTQKETKGSPQAITQKFVKTK